MFAEVKRNLPISGNAYDFQIMDQIRAAALDLSRTAEIILPGTIDISIDAQTGVVTDRSTLTDPLVTDAIILFCQMRIGNPPNYDKLEKAYESLKGSLRLSGDYTDYPTDPTEPDDGEPDSGEPDGGEDSEEDPGTDPAEGDG